MSKIKWYNVEAGELPENRNHVWAYIPKLVKSDLQAECEHPGYRLSHYISEVGVWKIKGSTSAWRVTHWCKLPKLK